MKIVVTCENNQVFQHFGHTPEFAVFTVENKNVVLRCFVKNAWIAGTPVLSSQNPA